MHALVQCTGLIQTVRKEEARAKPGLFLNGYFINNRWTSCKRLTMGSSKSTTNHGSNDAGRKRLTRTIWTAKPKPKPRIQPKPKPRRRTQQQQQRKWN